MKKLSFALSFSLLLLFLSACDNNEDLIWQPEILAPLAKGTLDISQEAVFSNVKVQYRTNSFNTGNSIVSFPSNTSTDNFRAFQNGTSFALTVPLDPSRIQNIQLDSLTMYGIITNPLPITLLAGMEVVLVNTGETSPIITHIIQRDIAPNGKYTFIERSSNVSLANTYQVYFQKASSPGSTIPITFTENSVILDYELNFAVNTVTFATNATSNLQIIEDFSLDFDESDELTGSIALNTTNTLPFTFQIQVFFFAEDKVTVLGSLSPTPITIAPGSSDNPNKESNVFEASAVLSQFKDIKAVGVLATYTVGAGGSGVTVNKNDNLSFKIIADAQVKIKTDN